MPATCYRMPQRLDLRGLAAAPTLDRGRACAARGPYDQRRLSLATGAAKPGDAGASFDHAHGAKADDPGAATKGHPRAHLHVNPIDGHVFNSNQKAVRVDRGDGGIDLNQRARRGDRAC
jgi:hypothetical protein